MTIHLMHINRAVPVNEAETRALFLAKQSASYLRDTETWQRCVEQLQQSQNAAVQVEARRLMAGRS